jgi:hypothetical protein
MWRLERRGKGWQGVLALTGRYIGGLAVCLIPLGLAFSAATFPGEWLDEHAGNKQWIPPNGVAAWLGAKDEHDKPIWTSFHDLLFNGDIDDVTRRRKSLFSNTLVLPHFDALEAAKIDDPKKVGSVKHSMVLRGRHLESAVFDNADLRKVDLSDAQLWGARLDSAQLQRASLESAQLQGAGFRLAQLQGASSGKVPCAIGWSLFARASPQDSSPSLWPTSSPGSYRPSCRPARRFARRLSKRA